MNEFQIHRFWLLNKLNFNVQPYSDVREILTKNSGSKHVSFVQVLKVRTNANFESFDIATHDENMSTDKFKLRSMFSSS